jgi:hypothetical protein
LKISGARSTICLSKSYFSLPKFHPSPGDFG